MGNQDGGALEEVPTKHLGPEYRPAEEKPKATVSKSLDLENLQVLPQTPQLIALLTYIRSIRPSISVSVWANHPCVV